MGTVAGSVAARLTRCAALATLIAAMLLGAAAASAQTAPSAPEEATTDPQKEIAIAPDVADGQIADRLQRILTASEWFRALDVSVDEGIVFIDGETETEERKEWARQLALRTEGVVAVVDRLDVKPRISWDLTPTWREVERLTERAQWFLPLTVVSVIILALTWLAARGVSALARRTLRGRIPSPLLLQFAARALAVPVVLIGIYLVLQVAGLTRLAITVLGGTGLVGIVIGFAFRDIAENSLASILLSVRNPFRAGDWIRVSDHTGIVQNLNMRTTVLLTVEGNHVQIPNAVVFKSIIENFSTSPNRREEFVVGIGYDDSVLEAQSVIIGALRGHPAVLDDPEPTALVDALGASTVDIRVHFWFDGRSYAGPKLRSALMRQVKQALQTAGISMPDSAREIIFPQGLAIRDASEEEDRMPKPPQDSAEARAGDAATATSGEGDLGSEANDLERQADAAELPEAAENLLASERDTASARGPRKG